MNVLVTGYSGFIGAYLSANFLMSGDNVYGTGSLNENELPEVHNLGRNFHNLQWDQLPPIDCLYHLAARSSALDGNRSEVNRVNYLWARKLFTEAVSQGVPRIVFASSAAVYGNTPPPFTETSPLNFQSYYAESKVNLERFARKLGSNSGTTIVGMRLSNVYGGIGEAHKGQAASMPFQLCLQMREKDPELFEWGQQSRDFVFVEDVVRAAKLCGQTDQSAVYNIGSGAAMSFNSLVEVLNWYLDTDRTPTYVHNPYTEFYQEDTLLDVSKAARQLEYMPSYTIERGIEIMIRRLSLQNQ